MRKTNEDGQFEDTCKGDGSCGACEERTVEIPEVEGNPYDGAGLSKYKPSGGGKVNVGKIEFGPIGNPLVRQVGGDHYKNFEIQPTEFIMRNKLSFLQGCVIKRICRYNLKGTAREDLEKAKHEIDLLIELEGL